MSKIKSNQSNGVVYIETPIFGRGSRESQSANQTRRQTKEDEVRVKVDWMAYNMKAWCRRTAPTTNRVYMPSGGRFEESLSYSSTLETGDNEKWEEESAPPPFFLPDGKCRLDRDE